jgi:NIPSNAP
MERRQFLAATLATSALGLAPNALAEATTSPSDAAPQGRQFYQLRRYYLRTGPQTSLTEHYFADALIPALTRLGLGPIGAFRLDFGPETPQFFLLIPGSSLEVLASLNLRLRQDAAYVEAAAPFWNAPATSPSFERLESSLLAAFEGWPHLTPPAPAANPAKRIFQLRTYESPSPQDHIRKIEMFHSGEFDIFRNAGFHPVFFSETLIGTRLPSLTYMLSFDSLAELDAKWDAFRDDPAWKHLSGLHRYNYEAIVSNISNQILTPLPASQI